ncbi:hypothetical protein EBT16_11315 [bacterium]|nr:hypothetical protein [bacterium]
MFRSDSIYTKFLLVGFIIAEIFLVRFVWKKSEPFTVRASLAKEGQHYILRWVNSDKTVDIKIFESPVVALHFAREHLSMEPGTNPAFNDLLETVWARKEMSKHVVFWKTVNFNMVHRLTFDNESYAKVFISAFRKGAYSPSPLGHSINFIKASAAQ